MAWKPQGLFFFWDSLGLPIESAIQHLRKTKGLTEPKLRRLIFWFIVDAMHAGWSTAKIQSDLREADRMGDLHLKDWITKL